MGIIVIVFKTPRLSMKNPTPHASLPYRKGFTALFISHPESVGESYFQHQRAAFKFAGGFFVLMCAALLHGLVPALCSHTAKNRVAQLQQQLQARTELQDDY